MWTVTCGPLTSHQVRNLIQPCYLRDKAACDDMLTPFAGKIEIGLPPASKVYIENQSKKLFVVSQMIK